MEQQIRFCTTADGVRIAYAIAGRGPPLLKPASWYSHLEFDWQSPVYKGLYQGLAARHRFIRYDARGTGLSDRDVTEISLETMVADFTAVADAVGLERFPLLGISQGGAVGISYAVRHPERVSHLVVVGAYGRGMAHRPGHTQGPGAMDALRAVMRHGWGSDDPSYRQLFTSQIIPDATPEQMRWFNEYERASASVDMADRLFVAIANINVMELLPLVRVPTLIFHSRGDRRQPFEFGRELAALIPNSRLIPLESNNHVVLENEPAFDVFFTELADFLGHKRPRAWTGRTRLMTGRSFSRFASSAPVRNSKRASLCRQNQPGCGTVTGTMRLRPISTDEIVALSRYSRYGRAIAYALSSGIFTEGNRTRRKKRRRGKQWGLRVSR